MRSYKIEPKLWQIILDLISLLQYYVTISYISLKELKEIKHSLYVLNGW